ncbi:MAG: low-specificity L-threonine aldolase [Candidatus Marinimicrobia bacterium]|nr:low-specificity L-threonine aldolase [Candidatus Neomarinimicrobiota bacterium]|tara:strand:- start:12048 stop:13082 length:1035 start_codon:yes stop_codon:yes gene_type:complete
MIDLRSDTVTLPTNKMKQFIMDSPLGDDVYGEDPSVNLLQNKIAKIFNKESALFVPSGTMANLISVLTHCNRGDEVILGNKSHIFFYEAGGISAFGGVHSHQINNNDDGTININDIVSAIRKKGDDHFPKTKLICLENTHNACYGSPINTDFFNEVKNIAKKHNIPIHLDGARIFNAAIALNKSVDELTKDCDSVSCCLSKGLSAPVGSVILGNKNFISKAKSLRKALGGGMRQAGLIASAGIFSLDHMVNRIKDDHSNAKILAGKLNLIKNIEINLNQVHTNIIFIYNRDKTLSNQDMLLSLEKNNIKIDYKGNSKFRLVTHSSFKKEDINTVIKVFRKIFKD